MKARQAWALSGSIAAMGAGIMSQSAQATYIGWSVQLYTSVGGHDVYRAYANFTNANDYLTTVYATAEHPIIVQTFILGGGLGGNFFNPGGTSGNTAPGAEEVLELWGTFATIGVSMAEQGSGPSAAPDLTQTSSLGNFINGSSYFSTSASWFTNGPVDQGRAGYAADGDAQLRVLLGQFSVNNGGFFHGRANLSGVNADGSAWSALDVDFYNSLSPPPPFVPGPAGVMAMMVAGAMGFGSRGRRRAI